MSAQGTAWRGRSRTVHVCTPHTMPRPLPTGEILEQILTPHGIKSLPPINQLLMEPFFKVGRGVVVERGGKSVASGGGRVMRDAVMRHERRRAAKKALPHASTAPGPIAHTLPHPMASLAGG